VYWDTGSSECPTTNWHLAQRALEEWERTLCENKAVAVLAQMQAGRPALIQKDGGEMLIAIVLDRPLADANALVDDSAAFTREMTGILLEKQNHPHIAKPAGSSNPPLSNSAPSSAGSHEHSRASQPVQFQSHTATVATCQATTVQVLSPWVTHNFFPSNAVWLAPGRSTPWGTHN